MPCSKPGKDPFKHFRGRSEIAVVGFIFYADDFGSFLLSPISISTCSFLSVLVKAPPKVLFKPAAVLVILSHRLTDVAHSLMNLHQSYMDVILEGR